jgi:hypothetical protein
MYLFATLALLYLKINMVRAGPHLFSSVHFYLGLLLIRFFFQTFYD